MLELSRRRLLTTGSMLPLGAGLIYASPIRPAEAAAPPTDVWALGALTMSSPIR